MMKFTLVALLILNVTFLYAQKPAKSKAVGEYVEIRVFHTNDAQQVKTIEDYLQSNLLPALHKEKFNRIGMFTAIANDTAKDKRVYLIIPFKSLLQVEQLSKLNEQLADSSTTNSLYVKAPYNHPAYNRMETILLKSFTGMPVLKAPSLQGDLEDRVYELRSYESASEAIHLNKVSMFNSGEIDLFSRLEFNAVFYGQVLVGCRMPNLMYMTSFNNKASREEHWKKFSNDSQWKSMSGNAKYQNNVSKMDIVFLRPTIYSQL